MIIAYPRGFRAILPGVARHYATSRVLRIRRVQAIERWFGDLKTIPGTNIKLGLDQLIGFVPIAGDLAMAGVSSYVIYQAARIGIPKRQLLKMSANSVADLVIGSIPIVGDLFDVYFRGFRKNMEIFHCSVAAK